MVERCRPKRKAAGLIVIMVDYVPLAVLVRALRHLQSVCSRTTRSSLLTDEAQQIEKCYAEEIQELPWQMNVLVMTCDDAGGRESHEVLEETYEEDGLEK